MIHITDDAGLILCLFRIFYSYFFSLAALAWFIGRLRLTRRIMAGTILAGCITLPSELYVNELLEAAGCDGNWMKGLSCPEWSILIYLAIWHHISGFVFFAYLISIFPFLWSASMYAEATSRFKNRRQNMPEDE